MAEPETQPTKPSTVPLVELPEGVQKALLYLMTRLVDLQSEKRKLEEEVKDLTARLDEAHWALKEAQKLLFS